MKSLWSCLVALAAASACVSSDSDTSSDVVGGVGAAVSEESARYWLSDEEFEAEYGGAIFSTEHAPEPDVPAPSYGHVTTAPPTLEDELFERVMQGRARRYAAHYDEVLGALESLPEPQRSRRIDQVFARIAEHRDVRAMSRAPAERDEDERVARILREEGVR